MPAHLEGRNIIAEVEGLNCALIVACNMCAGASFAMKENKPFIQFFRNCLTSPPLKRYTAELQSQLKEKGVETKWFRRGIIQNFFLCLWTSRQRAKFSKVVENYDAVLVLGCDSAFETIRNSVPGTACKVIEGTEFGGIMNTRARFHLPCNISFEESNVVRVCDRNCEKFGPHSK